MSTETGRLPAAQVGKPVLHDAPEKQVRAMMTQLDELVTAIKALAAKLDADATVTDTNYAALISASLKKLDLHL